MILWSECERGYALDLLPVTDKARMVYRELEIEIVRLERAGERFQRDDDDDYVPNLHNAAIG